MYYLEETRPQRPLLPQDVGKRAKVRLAFRINLEYLLVGLF